MALQTVICNNDNSHDNKNTSSFLLPGNLVCILQRLSGKGGGACGWWAKVLTLALAEVVNRCQEALQRLTREPAGAWNCPLDSALQPQKVGKAGQPCCWRSREATLEGRRLRRKDWSLLAVQMENSFCRPLLIREWRGCNIASVAVSLAVTAVEFNPINL